MPLYCSASIFIRDKKKAISLIYGTNYRNLSRIEVSQHLINYVNVVNTLILFLLAEI